MTQIERSADAPKVPPGRVPILLVRLWVSGQQQHVTAGQPNFWVLVAASKGPFFMRHEYLCELGKIDQSPGAFSDLG